MELMTEDSQERGNTCMKEEKYIEAMLHYTRGIKLEPQSPHLLSSRSIAFLHMQQYYHALEDAKAAIKMMPKWAKGYFHKGEIEYAAEHYAEAIQTYKQGLELVPNDTSLQNALAKAQALWISQRKVENRMPWYGLALGAVVGILLIVIDEAVSKNNPIFETDFVRTILLVVIVTVCYGFAVLYRYFLKSQRQSLLECPPDLLGDDLFASLFTEKSPNSTPSQSHTINSDSSPARKNAQQRKKGRH